MEKATPSMSGAYGIQALPILAFTAATLFKIIGAFFGALLTCAGVGSGVASAAALIARRSGAEIVGAEAARGGAAGFIIGIPVGVAAAIIVAVL